MSIIIISQKAQNYLQEIVKKKKKDHILRILIKFPGKKYAECKIFYDHIQNIRNTDHKIKYTYFSIYINNILIPYLKDAKIDLFENNLNKQLMLIAPYANQDVQNLNDTMDDFLPKSTLIFKQVQEYIYIHINPILSNHGGRIILKNITKLGYVLIEFLGGCNGCAMSHSTVKEGIEKKILNVFPTLKGVKDITKHHRGEHSFF